MSRFTDSGMPNPGSDEALAAGCLCAVMDNCHGKFAPYPPDDWWITEGCPIHSTSTTGADAPSGKDTLLAGWVTDNETGDASAGAKENNDES